MMLLVFSLILLSLASLADSQTHQGRIFGGEIVSIESIPYQVSVRYKGKHNCGGSIISVKHVVTALHCWCVRACVLMRIKVNLMYFAFFSLGFNIEHFLIHFGMNTRVESGTDSSPVDEIFVPPRESDVRTPDIGILQLTKTLQFSSVIQSIKLPEADLEIQDGTILQVSGFGLTSFVDDDDNLRVANIPKVNDDRCRSVHLQKIGKNITTAEICAGNFEVETNNACMGDSGGPLVMDNLLVGVVSRGSSACGEAGLPAVYVRVTAVRDWIRDTVGF
ncbi:trypsin-1-like [Phlebotomus argentipes]|uniref:trypsin-1-like n=1 Tax=Phlebotomus argentipes TaxID=94469 RepID=UPI002893115C|nr:trypsin-1-like [Phlebotomus argentipes]